MRIARWLGTAAIVFAVGGVAQAETIKIGVVLPFSGANADLGHQVDKAFDLYVKLHAKDIEPHKVEIVKRDEGPPTGAQAKTVATELITNDKVQILTGFVFSPSAIALAPVVTQAKVPMIIANAGTAWITNLSPYIVRLSFSMWHPAFPMGTYAAKTLGCKTAAMGYTDFPPGKDSTDAFKTGFEQAGGKIIDSIPMGNPAQVPDFTPFFQRVKDQKPDCFYVFIPGGMPGRRMLGFAAQDAFLGTCDAHVQRRVIAAGMVGNVLEWYDFAIYGYFASAIGRQFFPHENAVAQLLSAFGV